MSVSSENKKENTKSCISEKEMEFKMQQLRDFLSSTESLVFLYSQKIENIHLLEKTFVEYMKLLNFQSGCFFEEEYINLMFPHYIKAL